MPEEKNSRELFRIYFDNPLEGKLEIISSSRSVGETLSIGIVDIGAGGVHIQSSEPLPEIKEGSTLFISTVLMHQLIRYESELRWTRSEGLSPYDYGMQFLINEKEEAILLKLINAVAIERKRKQKE